MLPVYAILRTREFPRGNLFLYCDPNSLRKGSVRSQVTCKRVFFVYAKVFVYRSVRGKPIRNMGDETKRARERVTHEGRGSFLSVSPCARAFSSLAASSYLHRKFLTYQPRRCWEQNNNLFLSLYQYNVLHF